MLKEIKYIPSGNLERIFFLNEVTYILSEKTSLYNVILPQRMISNDASNLKCSVEQN